MRKCIRAVLYLIAFPFCLIGFLCDWIVTALVGDGYVWY